MFVVNREIEKEKEKKSGKRNKEWKENCGHIERPDKKERAVEVKFNNGSREGKKKKEKDRYRETTGTEIEKD